MSSKLNQACAQARPRLPWPARFAVFAASLMALLAGASPARADESHETAHVRGETLPFTVGEDQFRQAVDGDAADRALSEIHAHGVGQDVQIQVAHGNVGDDQPPGGLSGAQVPAEGRAHVGEMLSGVLEGDEEAGFAVFQALGDPAQRERCLPDARVADREEF